MITVLFIRNKFFWNKPVTWFYVLLRKVQNRWYNHVTMFDYERQVVDEYLGNGYNETNYKDWLLRQPEREFFKRIYYSKFTKNEIKVLKSEVPKVTTGYEFGYYWKYPLILINKKFSKIVKPNKTSFTCTDWVSFFLPDYNPINFYTLKDFEDIKEEDIIFISKIEYNRRYEAIK